MCCSGSAILSLERCAAAPTSLASRSHRVHSCGAPQVLLVWVGVDRRRDFAMASEDDSFKSTSQLLRDDSFKNSPLVTSKLSGSGSFKGQFTETENTRRRCAVVIVLVALALFAHAVAAPPSPPSPPSASAHKMLSIVRGDICADAVALRAARSRTLRAVVLGHSVAAPGGHPKYPELLRETLGPQWPVEVSNYAVFGSQTDDCVNTVIPRPMVQDALARADASRWNWNS